MPQANFFILSIVLFFSTSPLLAQEVNDTTQVLNEVVVTGTRYEIPVEKSGKTIYRIDSTELSRRVGTSTVDLLNDVPGLHLDGNFGTPGTNISYFARGGRNRQSLILLDGIPLNDPSGINLTYDLRYLPLPQIASLEILKGGLSTLYGTGAAASVINIALAEPGDQPIQGYLDVNAGSFQTFGQNALVNGKLGRLSYLLSANNAISQGFSAALDTIPREDFNEDGFSRQNLLLRLGYQLSSHWKLRLSGAWEQFEAEYDDGPFTDADNLQTSRQYRVGIHPSYSYQRGSVELNALINRNHREFESSFPTEYYGTNRQFDLVQKHRFGAKWKGIWGLNIQQLSYEETGVNAEDSTAFTIVDPYASIIFSTDQGFNLQTGIRLNTHSEYGTQPVYNVNPSYLLDLGNDIQLKFLTSWSTSYITPSLFQLYSFFGNTGLEPESSENWEGGAAWYYHDKITLNAVYFRRTDREVIDFVSRFDDEGNYIGGNYENLVIERGVYGVEADIRFEVNEQISSSAFFTFTQSDQPESLIRIPNFKAGGSITSRPVTELSLTLRYLYTGERITPDFASDTNISLADYHLFDLAGQYLIGNHWKVYATLNNLFNTQFIGIYGFTTRGRNSSLGVQYRF